MAPEGGSFNERTVMRHFEQKHIVASAVLADAPEAGRTSAAPTRGALVRFKALVGGWLRRLEQARRSRRDMMLFMELDYHLLKDINITRDEVRAIASGYHRKRDESAAKPIAARRSAIDGD
jgi:uncharacterized protein YjiS (DUF1127 family)